MNTFEWITMDGSKATVGITKEALKEIGEIVYVELPKVGSHVEKGQEVVVLESTKAAIDLYSPLTGKISSVNQALIENVALINHASEKDGWLYTIES